MCHFDNLVFSMSVKTSIQKNFANVCLLQVDINLNILI